MENQISSNLGSLGRGPTKEEELERLKPLIKQFRVEVDALIKKLPYTFDGSTPETIWSGIYLPKINEAQAQVRISLTNAKMWAGKMLEGLGSELPAEFADKSK